MSVSGTREGDLIHLVHTEARSWLLGPDERELQLIGTASAARNGFMPARERTPHEEQAPKTVWSDRAALRLEREERSTNFVRSFAYATGAAYALLLDAVRPQWRKQISGQTDLSRLLAEAIGFEPPSGIEGSGTGTGR